jgi:RimJ/RimL family protein N-acetyltransferase
MKIQPTTFLGKRAQLVPMEESHIDALYEAGQFPEIWSWWPVRIRTHEEMARLVRTFLHAQEQGQAFPFTILDQQSGQVVGSTRLHAISHENRSLEIGKTWLTPSVWGTHLNTECKYLLLRYCFETLETLRVQFKTDVRNIRSQRAIERLGAVREGVLRHHWIMPDGHIRDSVLYSILLEEWPMCKEHLEQLLQAASGTKRD